MLLTPWSGRLKFGQLNPEISVFLKIVNLFDIDIMLTRNSYNDEILFFVVCCVMFFVFVFLLATLMSFGGPKDAIGFGCLNPTRS